MSHYPFTTLRPRELEFLSSSSNTTAWEVQVKQYQLNRRPGLRLRQGARRCARMATSSTVEADNFQGQFVDLHMSSQTKSVWCQDNDIQVAHYVH